MTLIENLTSTNRLFEVLFDNCPNYMKDSELYKLSTGYLQSYLDYQKLTIDNLASVYSQYIINYNKHCKGFLKTGKYPRDLGITNYQPSRAEYDLVLLMSVIFTSHRFQIMNLLRTSDCSGKALYIGIGPGLELSLTEANHESLHAYDLSINSFLQTKYASVSFFEELYIGQHTEYFNTIYLIELLEHLENPYLLIDICYKSLAMGGKLVLTTASDVPQFDHLFNFPKDHIEFESDITNMGFEINKKVTIEHKYLVMQINSSNTFYILTKK